MKQAHRKQLTEEETLEFIQQGEAEEIESVEDGFDPLFLNEFEENESD